MKRLQVSVKVKEILCSLMITACIGFALIQMEVLPLQQEVKTLSEQNPALKAKVKMLKKWLKDQDKGLSSNEFYLWFKAQNFDSLKLLSLKGNPESLQVSLAGNFNTLLPFLDAVQNSRFVTLSLSNMQSSDLFLDLEFSALETSSKQGIVDVPTFPEPQKRSLSSVPNKVLTKTKVLGTARQHGVKFCVLEVNGALRLQKEGKC